MRLTQLLERLQDLVESPVTDELLRQWQTHGPKVVKTGGKKFTFRPKMSGRVDQTTMRFVYVGARDIRGLPKMAPAALNFVAPPPKVLFDVTYVPGRDSYDITIEHHPGPATLDSPPQPPTKRKLKDMYWSHFENLGDGDVMRLGRPA